jgi:hypothetical protein
MVNARRLVATDARATKVWSTFKAAVIPAFHGVGRFLFPICAEELISLRNTYQAHIEEKLSLKHAHELVQQAVQWASNQSHR